MHEYYIHIKIKNIMKNIEKISSFGNEVNKLVIS
jgi:hypothetical protein